MNAAAKYNILSYIAMELVGAADFAQRGFFYESFGNLERAHVLAQSATRQLVRVHYQRLRWAVRRADIWEFFAQLPRIVGAASLRGLIAAKKEIGALEAGPAI